MFWYSVGHQDLISIVSSRRHSLWFHSNSSDSLLFNNHFSENKATTESFHCCHVAFLPALLEDAWALAHFRPSLSTLSQCLFTASACFLSLFTSALFLCLCVYRFHPAPSRLHWQMHTLTRGSLSPSTTAELLFLRVNWLGLPSVSCTHQ